LLTIKKYALFFCKSGLKWGFRKTSLNAKEVFRKPTSASFIDKAGCTQQFESDLSLRSLAPLFPI